METIFASDLVKAIVGNLPFFIPAIVGVVIYIVDLFWQDEEKDFLVYLAAGGMGGLVLMLWRLWLAGEPVSYLGFSVSRFGLMLLIVVSVIAFLSVLLGYQYCFGKDKGVVGFVVYLMFGTFGLISTLATANLIVMFVGLVAASIAFTFLLKFYEGPANTNLIQKFWIYSLITDVLFCLGVSFYYGATGSLEVGEGTAILNLINEVYSGNFFRIGTVLLGVSLMAKMAAVPFHWWLLDVVNSDRLPVINVLSIFYRTAVMLLSIKILAPMVNIWGAFFEAPLIAVAIITMTWANLAAVKTSELRSLLGYSSIAQVGYFLILLPTLMVDSAQGLTTLIVFVVAFSVMHLGAFALLHFFSDEGALHTKFENLDGLGRRHPWSALVFCLFLFALAGAPPLITFLARFMMIREIALSGNYFVLVAVVINMIMAVFYYTRPMVRMFLMRPTKYSAPASEVGYPLITVIVFTALVAIYLGIQPSSFIKWIQLSIAGM